MMYKYVSYHYYNKVVVTIHDWISNLFTLTVQLKMTKWEFRWPSLALAACKKWQCNQELLAYNSLKCML